MRRLQTLAVVTLLVFLLTGCGQAGSGNGADHGPAADSAELSDAVAHDSQRTLSEVSETRDAGEGEQFGDLRNDAAQTGDPGGTESTDEGCLYQERCLDLCGPCARDLSCEECPLRLEVFDREDAGGFLRRFTLLLSFAAEPDDPRPTIADIQFSVEGSARLTDIELLDPVTSAGKTAVADPDTGLPFKDRGEGRYQILMLSTASDETMAPGPWLRLSFLAGGFSGPPTQPVVVTLTKREQIFAPPPADALLWGSPLDQPVVLRHEAD